MAWSIPNSLGEAGRRMKHNLCNFATNYAIFIFFIFFLSVFGHSFSMFILITFFFGGFLLFLHDEHPIVLFNCRVDIIAVLALLGVLTIWALLLAVDVWLNLLVSILIGSALAGLQAVLRETEDPTMPTASDAASVLS